MNNLFTLKDVLFNGYLVGFVDILSIIALLFGITIIISKNPIESLLYLIGLFASIAIYLITSGLTFIGFSYLIVYIGAVSILFLFILMLINIRTSELQSNNSNSIPLALFIAILLSYSIFQLLPYYLAVLNNYNSKISNILYYAGINKNSEEATYFNQYLNLKNNSHSIMFTSSNNWDGNLTETSHISAIGNIIYTSYNMWLLIASLILLLAMTGAIIITINNDKKQ